MLLTPCDAGKGVVLSMHGVQRRAESVVGTENRTESEHQQWPIKGPWIRVGHVQNGYVSFNDSKLADTFAHLESTFVPTMHSIRTIRPIKGPQRELTALTRQQRCVSRWTAPPFANEPVVCNPKHVNQSGLNAHQLSENVCQRVDRKERVRSSFQTHEAGLACSDPYHCWWEDSEYSHTFSQRVLTSTRSMTL